MFDLAIDNRDETTMREILQEVRDSKSFGLQSPLYKYCAATTILLPVAAKQTKRESLDDADKKVIAHARKLVDEAIVMRPEWNVLWRVRGEIEQFEKNIDGAIASYQRALEYNRTGQAGIGRRLVQLLYVNNRFLEANEALKYAGDQSQLPDIWKHTVEDIKFRSGGVDSAVDLAKQDAERDPGNASNQIWYGQLLNKAGRADEAGGGVSQGDYRGFQSTRCLGYPGAALAVDQKSRRSGRCGA